jgi:hypothetical protein
VIVAGEAGLAGDVQAFVGEHGHDARRQHGREARLVGYWQHARALGLAQGMAGYRAQRLRPAIAADEAFIGLSALLRAHGDAHAGQAQARADKVCGIDVSGDAQVLCRQPLATQRR